MKLALYTCCILCVLVVSYSCKYKNFAASSPYGDSALFDSTQNNSNFIYYRNKPDTTYAGNHGPHGEFKLKFNKIAYTVLTDSGRIPKNAKFPNGSLIVKEVVGNGIKALMYKKNNAWLWGEYESSGKTIFSVGSNNTQVICINCHSQSANRDLVNSFYFY